MRSKHSRVRDFYRSLGTKQHYRAIYKKYLLCLKNHKQDFDMGRCIKCTFTDQLVYDLIPLWIHFGIMKIKIKVPKFNA